MGLHFRSENDVNPGFLVRNVRIANAAAPPAPPAALAYPTTVHQLRAPINHRNRLPASESRTGPPTFPPIFRTRAHMSGSPGRRSNA